jgi:hypothetical protein
LQVKNKKLSLFFDLLCFFRFIPIYFRHLPVESAFFWINSQ